MKSWSSILSYSHEDMAGLRGENVRDLAHFPIWAFLHDVVLSWEIWELGISILVTYKSGYTLLLNKALKLVDQNTAF